VSSKRTSLLATGVEWNERDGWSKDADTIDGVDERAEMIDCDVKGFELQRDTRDTML
jgi:hypothetical protein